MLDRFFSKVFGFLIVTIVFSIFSNLYAQGISLTEDSKFEQLLNEKRKLNVVLGINDAYKIQIFSGSNENARKTLAQFRLQFSEVDATIVFNTPNYKVWAGCYRTRIGAEKAMLDFSVKFKNLLLIKPNK
jgi:hypothetical protein